MTSTNPVHRIYNLLDEANTKRPNLSISGVWSEVFELEPKNKVLLSRLASDLHKLFLIAIEQVERLLTKDEYDIYIVAFNAIKPLFEPFSWDREWGNRNLGQFLKDLKLCAITLSRMEEANEKLVDLEKLKSLREMAVELQEEVFSADLPNDFKTILLDNLSNIIYAVDTYNVLGKVVLNKAFESAVGSMFVSSYKHGQTNRKKSSPKEDSFRYAFQFIVLQFQDITDINLVDQGQNALEPPILVRLRDILYSSFDLNEMDDLCFEMGVKEGDIKGDTLRDKARSIVNYMYRRNQLKLLIETIKKERPSKDLSAIENFQIPQLLPQKANT
jgi:hypothetical protein